MELAMSELPLALFSTLAPMGAGAFGLLSLAFMTTKFSDEQLRRIDRLTAIPLIVVAIGFVCSFFHLASPMNAMQVFAGLGSSPLSNEILAGVVFTVAAIVYWVLAIAGKLKGTARTGFALVIAVLAAVFAVFVGMAYMMETIASWNSPFVPVQMLGYLFLGGSAFGVLVLGLAGSLDEARSGSFKAATMGVVVLGAVLAIGGLAGQIMGVSGMENAMTSGAGLVASATMPMAIAVIALIVAAVAALMALRGVSPMVLATVAPIVADVGIFFGRMAFYGVEMSVGQYVGL